jgi:putative Mg2+ transporter-C (MgtC) family protein
LFPDQYFQELNTITILVRVGIAMILGGLLGLERTRKRRAAGLRTYILVCVSSAIVMMTAQFIMSRFGNTDPARLGAQVISGIGFLGAGTILVTGVKQIRGLTTAAGLWAAACMGLAIGIGFYSGAAIMCAAIFIVMTGLEWVQSRYVSKMRRIRLYIVFETIGNIGDFLVLSNQMNIQVSDFETLAPEAGAGVGAVFMLQFREKKSHAEIIQMLRHCPGLTLIEEI